MNLYGIDISSWQSDLDINQIACDFIIVKATEGIEYVNPTFNKHAQQTINSKKRLGFYHYAQNRLFTAEKEADFFLKTAQEYFYKGIPILDWEENTQDIQWAFTWLQRVEQATGVKPIIYMSESVVNQHDWSNIVNHGYGLWVAKYKDYTPNFNFDMTAMSNPPAVKHWPFYAMWQFTSVGQINGYLGNLDCNIFYGDQTAWDQYTKKKDSSYENITTPTNLSFKIGDHVRFSTCYQSAYDNIDKHIDASMMLKDQGIITAIYPNTNNPYLLDDGLCFVNNGDIREVLNSAAPSKVTFPQSGGTWNVYPLNTAPVYGNQIGQINPGYYGDLTYTILDRPMNDVVTIDTEIFGRVNVYASPDDGVRFN